MTEHEQRTSLLDAWLGYETYVLSTLPPKKADATLAQVRTALLRYTLPAWGFPLPQGQRLTAEEYKQGLQFFSQIELARLQEAPALQEKLFEQLEVSGNSRRNYRWALKNFLGWCIQQSWSTNIAWVDRDQVEQPQRSHKGSATDVRVTNRTIRPSYRLAEGEISHTLRQEIQQFQEFLTNSERTSPSKRRNSRLTAEKFSHYALRFLGWMHYTQGVPLADLRIQSLVPTSPTGEIETGVSSEGGTPQDTLRLVNSYLHWLEKQETAESEQDQTSLSSHTVLQIINVWIEITKFVFYQRNGTLGQKTQECISTVTALHELQKGARASLKNHRPVSDESKKLMSWRDFLELVEHLRHECKPRLNYGIQAEQEVAQGCLRSLSAIAYSYQRFLCAALLSYIPPPKQQTLRHLKLTTSDELAGYLRNDHDTSPENLIFRTEDQWWLKIKDRKEHNPSTHYILIPNLRYPDARHFYQYLEEWLFHYEYQDEQRKSNVVKGLRSCFTPQHQYFFTLKNGQPYQNSSAFATLLRNPAYRLKGKVLTPDLVRQMFATEVSRMQENTTVGQKDLDHNQLLSPERPAGKGTPVHELSESQQQWAAAIAQIFIDEVTVPAAP